MKRNTKFILTTVLVILVLVTIFSAAMAFILTSPKAESAQPLPATVMAMSAHDIKFE